MTEHDFNHRATLREALSSSIVEKIDAALIAAPRWPSRTISASAIGDDCPRRIQLEVWASFHPAAAPVKCEPFAGKTLRIFERGYWGEAAMANWLKQAGFQLSTESSDTGKQHTVLTGGGQIKGKLDGVVIASHVDLNSIATPCVWEHKTLGAKGWKATVKHGVAKESPKYADQVAFYQAYKDLTHPALFSALNADTCELWFELIPFDHARAQAASDRAVHILQATRAGDLLPKAAANGEAYPCSLCRFKGECWGE